MPPVFSQRALAGTVFILCAGVAAWLGTTHQNDGPAEEPACVTCRPAPAVEQARWTDATSAAAEAAGAEAGRPGLPVPPALLPPRQSDLWSRPVAEPAFDRFREWTARWRAAAALAPAALPEDLEAEGVALARARRTALGDLIQADPARALQLAVPARLGRELPASVAAWLETWVNRRADYFVACAIAAPGRKEDPTRLVRWAEWEGARARVFTHGTALDWVTRAGAPLHGIVLPAGAGTNPSDDALIRAGAVMALSASPGRQLEAEELPPGTRAAIGLEIGGQISLHADPAAARTAAVALAAADEGTGPAVAAAGGDAAVPLAPSGSAAAELPTAASGRTEGYKRLLFLRVDFEDYAGEQATIPLAEAETLLRDMRSYCLLMSYGLHGIAPVGPGGSAITPILRMGGKVASYDNEGLSRLYPEARSRAAAAGFDLSKFDYDGVLTKGRPAAGYAGLAYVGGRGFHMANGYFGKHVTTHEYGHNLGLPHAHRWDTDDESIVGPGTPVEYGNPYDPMGSAFDSIPGEKHYTGGYKNYLDWIPDADAPLVTTSGLYRLTASDVPQSRGRRALRLRKDSRDYWIEYRQGLDTPLIAHGVFLQWGNADGRENYLLDALPGVSGTTLAVGRTFSDPRAGNGAGLHLTPVGRGGTFPESMDVQVTIGNPAGNLPPTAVVTANTTAAPANTPVVFTATATDPNGDALAHAWDFGDGSFSTDNEARQSHSFSAAGEYAVQCTVSDMRGGTSRAAVVVRVDAPSTFRLTGRVLDPGQQPIAGVQVTAASGSERKLATTDSAGVYVLTNVGARAWTLTARETVADTLNFSLPFHTNPVSVGPNLEGVDFIASTGPQETVTPLVGKGSVWKWFAQGGDPPAGWSERSFDDAAWEEGAGVLGYGNEGGQATTLPFGPTSATKWTGSFFRRAFALADPAQFPTLRLEAMRDDGVIIHLNGHEIFRDNLPAGPVTYATQASDATEPNDYIVRNLDVAALPVGLLVAGTNYLTASVHQATSTSSDLAFDAALSGVAPIAGVGSAVAYLTEPAAGEHVASTAPAVTLRAGVRVKNDTIARVEFFGDGARLGEDLTAPFSFDWPTPAPGPHTAHIVATWTGGGSAASATTAFTVAPPPATLVAANSVWSYRAEHSPAPADWMRPGFDDAGWPAGPAQLGFGEGDEATVIPGGTPTNRPLTSYFRHTFAVEDPRAVTDLVARLIRDDGAVVWLNGFEVIRSNLPATGSISYHTLATGAGPNAIDNAAYTFPLDPAALVAGPNVLAVEVHQSDATSSDLSFALTLEARTSAPRPRGLTLSAPSAVAAPHAVELGAEGVAGGALGLARVEFRAGGVLLGADVTAPFAFTWPSPPVGVHVLTAVATDTAGAAVSSDPVSLTVTPPPAGTALISFGEWWRYLDEGAAPSAGWRERLGYDDASWSQGLARLGYGGDGEVTIIGHGQQASARHITTWLRKRFTVATPAAFDSLRLRLIRDDGAVVWLNGSEILRSNLPAGTITPTTLASTEIAGAAERAVSEAAVPSALLVAGENVLAVEVHQASAASADLGVDLELVGVAASAEEFHFTSPAASQTITAAVDLPLSVWAAPAMGVTRVEYSIGPAMIGFSEEVPYFPVSWTTPLLGTFDLTARAVLAGGGTRTAGPITLTVGEPRVSALFVPAGAVWKYWDVGTLPAAAWNAPGHLDTAWKSGAARLGFGADFEATAVQSGHLAYYFRKSFTVSSLADVAEVILRFQRDDGVVIYLNGQEVARDNMPAGLPLPTTPATADAASEQAWLSRVLPPSVLQFGTNILAAEVHQRSATSSDVGWDAELTARGVNLLAVANTAPTAAPLPELSVLTGPGGVADGWQFRFPETDGRLYVVEHSEDLSTWLPHSYEFARAGQIAVPLPAGPAASDRYYRARWLPTLP